MMSPTVEEALRVFVETALAELGPERDTNPTYEAGFEEGMRAVLTRVALYLADEDSPKMSEDSCICGHDRSAHIYWEGACRPGFVCSASCTKFKQVDHAEL